ncbi:hypothetical protein [Algoriphagus pacificus]|uniref:DUF4369 domain-containing protein n=1 Tax=Algoriphagus pacificus TaxID=2811234 RepID=A0ABS3CBX4_9BACT|nr:hypothetical protein [Algoriphagus pacificus]MBN7814031.1 hypothetical protein [Algoriphagus pacificus]
MLKHLILSWLLLTLAGYSFAQTTAPGYYITLNNDSIPAQIKMPKSVFGSVDFSKFLFKVDVQDSNNSMKKFKPEDIKRFGFIYNDENFTLYSKPIFTETTLRFLQPTVLGEKSSLYQFQTYDQNGVPLGIFYTLEKSDGTYAFLTTGLKSLDKFKELLKEFYEENPDLLQLIDSRFTERKSVQADMVELVETANK